MKKAILTQLFILVFPLLLFPQSFKVGQIPFWDRTMVADSSRICYAATQTSGFPAEPQLFPFDINKDNVIDFNIFLRWYDRFYEYVYNTGIRSCKNCQVILIEEGTEIDSINWNAFPLSPASFIYVYSKTALYPGDWSYYESSGTFKDKPNQYLAFRITTSDTSRIITGWINVYSNRTSVCINRYAFVTSDKSIITHVFSPDPLLDNSVKIYPNPSKGELVIDINKHESFTVEIYNLTGERVFSKKNTGEKIDISRLSKGIYVIRIHGKDITYTSKLIVDTK